MLRSFFLRLSSLNFSCFVSYISYFTFVLQKNTRKKRILQSLLSVFGSIFRMKSNPASVENRNLHIMIIL